MIDTTKNINWQSLNARQIRTLINNWGQDTVAATPKARKVAGKRAVVNIKRTKRTGADGEVRWVAERGMYYGFFGGRAVFARKTLDVVVQHIENTYKIAAKVAA